MIQGWTRQPHDSSVRTLASQRPLKPSHPDVCPLASRPSGVLPRANQARSIERSAADLLDGARCERSPTILSRMGSADGRVTAAVRRVMKPLLVFALLLGLAWLPACDADEQPGRPAEKAGAVPINGAPVPGVHPEPYTTADAPPPPPFNRWVDPQSGKFVVPEFDDREIGVEMKEQYPLVDPRWRPFSACMNAAGFVVGAPDAFQKADLTKLLAGANGASSPLAKLKLNAGDALPGLAGAFLKCADQWLAIPVSEFPKYGFVTVFPDIPGLK